VFAILSGFWLALFTVFMRMQKEKSPYESFLLAHLTTFIISIPFIAKLGLPDSSGLIGIFLLGIFQTGFASLLFAYGIRKVVALKSMLILTLEPILNPIWVFIFTREAPGANTFMGGAIIIGGVIFTTIYSARKNRLKVSYE